MGQGQIHPHYEHVQVGLRKRVGDMQQTASIGGRYILHQKLGKGGMGTVYRATDRLTGDTVALKQMSVPISQLQFASRPSLGKSNDSRLALAREFKTLASLRHPHTPPLRHAATPSRRHAAIPSRRHSAAPPLRNSIT